MYPTLYILLYICIRNQLIKKSGIRIAVGVIHVFARELQMQIYGFLPDYRTKQQHY